MRGGVEEQAVDRAVAGDGGVERGEQRRLVADVAGQGEGRRADRLDRRFQHVGPPRDQAEPAARRRDPLRRRPADAGRAAGDDDVLSGEIHVSLPGAINGPQMAA